MAKYDHGGGCACGLYKECQPGCRNFEERQLTDHYSGSASERNKAANGGSVEQVGGDHYAAEYQHWDWVVDTRLGYLEGNATKYLARWWNKNGPEDLLKAQSYVEKLLECCRQGRARNQSDYRLPYEHDRRMAKQKLKRFCDSAKVGPHEMSIMSIIAEWDKDADLVMAIADIKLLWQDATAGQRARPSTGLTKPPPAGLRTPVDLAGGRATMAAATGSGNPEAHGWQDGMDHPFGYDAKEEN